MSEASTATMSERKLVQPRVSEGKLVQPGVSEGKLLQPSVSEGKLSISTISGLPNHIKFLTCVCMCG